MNHANPGWMKLPMGTPTFVSTAAGRSLRGMTCTLACIFCCLVQTVRADWVIDTVAGTGNPENNGDSGSAPESNLDQPFGVEFGPDGALYITEVGQHRVRRLDLETEQISTWAGGKGKGYAGDGGMARLALLNEPYEVRFDAEGAMYFVEMQNHLVRRVQGDSHKTSTVAGTGKPGYAGDGGPAIKAEFSSPHSIALDDRGYLYIADIGNHRIRRVELKTGQIDCLSGDGRNVLPKDGALASTQPLSGPRALYVTHRTLWVGLREGNSVWRIDLDTECIQHVAGTGEKGFSGDGGPALEATFDGPKGIAVAKSGLIYVVDTENHAIREINPHDHTIRTVAGGGPDSGGFGGDGGPAKKAQLNRPHGICVGPDGALYIGDTNNHRVRRMRLMKDEG